MIPWILFSVGCRLIKKLLSILLLGSTCVAQTIAVRAGHLVDPAKATVADNQVILINDGKITGIGADLTIPAGVAVVDLSKQWVLPGLVDAHTHITMNLPVNPPGGSLWEEKLVHESTAFRTARGLHNAEILLNAGFLALRDVGNNGDYGDIAVRQAIETGWFKGPTIIGSGKIITEFGGQSHEYAPEAGSFWLNEYIDAENPDEIRKAIHKNIFYGAGVIKLAADNNAYFYTENDIRAAVDEAHNAGLKVAVHVYGGKAADNVINAGADSVEHGFDLTEDQLRRMKQKGTYLVGTDFPVEHLVAFGGMVPLDAKSTSDKVIKRLADAHKIGVKMAFGSDVVVDLPGETRADMSFDFLKVWQRANVPAADILRAWTVDAYNLLGIEKKQGPIAVGLAGDMIAVPENPLQNISILRKVDFVMKDGEVIRHP
jgi:imidazolonepropionase-like amidohydrolase